MSLSAASMQLLERVFGFDELRDGQEEVITRLLAGRSTLAIFPTGGGKSLCYQFPALHFDGLTLVVSPLIALMKDQLDFLARKNVPAARIDSTLELAEYRKVMDELSRGRLKLLYVAPERLANERFMQTLRRLKLSLLAVDEAHCISEWGHNFRPDYLRLAKLAQDLRIPRVLALTATAPPSVASDIARGFRIAEGDIIRTGFYRSNLKLFVTPCRPHERLELLMKRLHEQPRGPTIIYVTLQKTAEDVAGALARQGFPAKPYHAGMENEVRAAVQDRFMASPDAIVVATIAFGMGIDKANIRAVYHYNLPKTLENYAQEIGRAGRDGLEARCELLATESDRIVLENFTYGDTPTPEAIAGLVDHILDLGETFDISTYELSATYDIRVLVLETVLTYLELDGVLATTGPFFDEYKFRPQRASKEILARFDPERAAFLRRLFGQTEKLQTWFRLDVAKAAAALSEPRGRIVAALNYLEEQGDLELQVVGARIGYRRLTRPVREPLLKKICERFQERESRDLQRLKQVLEYATHDGCRTRFLGRYFGDQQVNDCGHCGWCRGERNVALPETPQRPLSEEERKLLETYRAKRYPALGHPRQLARFFCGLSSPAASRAKLTKELAFGTLSDVSFPRVLEWVEAER